MYQYPFALLPFGPTLSTSALMHHYPACSSPFGWIINSANDSIIQQWGAAGWVVRRGVIGRVSGMLSEYSHTTLLSEYSNTTCSRIAC